MDPTRGKKCLALMLAFLFLSSGLSGFGSDDPSEKPFVYNPEDLYVLDLPKELNRLEVLLGKKPAALVSYTLLVKKAQLQFALQKLPDATKSLAQALKIKPKGKMARYFKAKILLSLQDYKKANQELDDLVADFPRFTHLYADLAVVALALEPKRAFTLIDQAIALDKSHAYFYLLRALINYQNQKNQKAMVDFSKAIELGYGSGGVDSALPYLGRSILFQATDRHREALRDALFAKNFGKGKTILDISTLAPIVGPLGPDAYEFQIWSNYYTENKIHICQEIVDSLPVKAVDTGPMAVAKAMMLLKQQKTKEALALLGGNEKRLEKDSPRVFYWVKGNAYCAQGKYSLALEMYDKLFLKKQYDIGLGVCKARIWACCPDKDFQKGAQAVEMLESFCSWTDHKAPRLLLELAIAYGATGQFDKGRDSARKAVELLPRESNLRAEFEDVAQKLKNKKAIYFKEGFWQMPYFPF